MKKIKITSIITMLIFSTFELSAQPAKFIGNSGFLMDYGFILGLIAGINIVVYFLKREEKEEIY